MIFIVAFFRNKTVHFPTALHQHTAAAAPTFPTLPFPALHGAASLLPFGLPPTSSLVNPFALSALCGARQSPNFLKVPKMTADAETALDLSPSSDIEEDDVDILSVDVPSTQSSNIEDWTVTDVSEFVNTVDSCQEYSQVFREHCIDGSGLVVLSESHMTRILGMKLGPVIRLKAAIARLLRRSTSPSSSLASV